MDDIKKKINAVISSPRVLLRLAGLLLLLLEIWKQLYLYLIVFDGHYNVWYIPFQLCSRPMYMCRLSSSHRNASHGDRRNWKEDGRARGRALSVIATFMQDFGILGGIAALVVHEGFTFAEHPLLTAHGYIWHVLLILIGLYIWRQGLSDLSPSGCLRSCGLFLGCAAVAELINVVFHEYGDCDMFYITPYHLSSQIIFRDIDAMIGRPMGIVVYLICVMLGAGIVHGALKYLSFRKQEG